MCVHVKGWFWFIFFLHISVREWYSLTQLQQIPNTSAFWFASEYFYHNETFRIRIAIAPFISCVAVRASWATLVFITVFVCPTHWQQNAQETHLDATEPSGNSEQSNLLYSQIPCHLLPRGFSLSVWQEIEGGEQRLKAESGLAPRSFPVERHLKMTILRSSPSCSQILSMILIICKANISCLRSSPTLNGKIKVNQWHSELKRATDHN